MTTPASVVRSSPVPEPAPSTLAFVILCFILLAAIVAALLLALGFENRATLRDIKKGQTKLARDVKRQLTSERACVLRDVTRGSAEQDADAPSSDEFF